jgi:molecular chaperone GrpE
MAVNHPHQPESAENDSEVRAANVPPDVEVAPAEDVEAQVRSALAERDELRDQLLRTRAEMDNMRKRMNRERDEDRNYAALPFVRDLLPCLDNLHRAIAAGQQNHDVDTMLQGVQMVAKQFEDVLAGHGVQSIPAHGLAFDPNKHEALQQQPSAEVPPMTVLLELEQGFQLHDRVIRPTKVIVAGPPAAEE